MYSEHMFTLQETHPLQNEENPPTPVTPQLVWLRVSDGTVRRFMLDLETAELKLLDPNLPDPQQELPLGSNKKGATPKNGTAPRAVKLTSKDQ